MRKTSEFETPPSLATLLIRLGVEGWLGVGVVDALGSVAALAQAKSCDSAPAGSFLRWPASAWRAWAHATQWVYVMHAYVGDKEIDKSEFLNHAWLQ